MKNRFYQHFSKLFSWIFLFFVLNFSTSYAQNIVDNSTHPADAISLLEKAYPSKIKKSGYDIFKKKWFIVIQNASEKIKLYWYNQCFLPEKYINSFQDKNDIPVFEPLFSYKYPDEIPNPSNFSKDWIDYLKNISAENSLRRTQPKGLEFLYNALYDGETKTSIAKQIVKSSFFGKRVNIHKDIVEPLKKVEEKILIISKTNDSVEKFIKDIHSIGGFNWRDIRSSENRSSHSWGISIDIMPILRGKEIYWEWTQYSFGDKWITMPLKNRWIPPKEVIEAFESEGFIWGGKWDIWDNMHFEYRPEMLF